MCTNRVDDYVVAPVISIPFLFWGLNMVWLGLVCFALMKFMQYLAAKGTGFLSLRIKVNRKVNLEKFYEWLSEKSLTTAETITEKTTTLKKVSRQS